MFCGLNGRTARPRRTKARARPATIIDFPTLLPVPWIMSARAMGVPDVAVTLAHRAGLEKPEIRPVCPGKIGEDLPIGAGLRKTWRLLVIIPFGNGRSLRFF
jgi:hypothetical protein